jgi:heterodisulfide reductase subunit B2
MSYGYFPGCSLRATGRAYEESLLALFQLLHLDLEELEDWNCCGATSYMSIDEHSAFLLSARNLAMARERGKKELVAPCSACYLVLRKTQDYVERYPSIGKELDGSMGTGCARRVNEVKVRHPLEVLYKDVGLEKIRSRVARHWHGAGVACYYGCQVVRPYGEVDSEHDPRKMDELLTAAGVPTVEFSLKTKCCGGTLTGTVHEVGVRMNYILLKEAVRRGAQAIATLCPLCQFNLDAYQREIRRETGERIDMPVLYFTQILGWALGADVEQLGLHRSIAGRRWVEEWAKAEAPAYV